MGIKVLAVLVGFVFAAYIAIRAYAERIKKMKREEEIGVPLDQRANPPTVMFFMWAVTLAMLLIVLGGLYGLTKLVNWLLA